MGRKVSATRESLIQRRIRQLEAGFFLYARYTDRAVICGFYNDFSRNYTFMKYDYRLGIRWCFTTDTARELIALMRVFRHIGGWRRSYKTAFWRDLPPATVLALGMHDGEAFMPVFRSFEPVGEME